MNLHEAMAGDLDAVFLNLEEFACGHVIEGKNISCIVDDLDGLAQTKSSDGFANASGIGILECQRLVLCRASDMIPQPLPGQKIVMDGKFWIVGEDLAETEGLLSIPLTRAY